MTRTELRQDQEANRGNRRIAVHALALDILRNGSSLMTMAEAIRQAEAIVGRKGGR